MKAVQEPVRGPQGAPGIEVKRDLGRHLVVTWTVEGVVVLDVPESVFARSWKFVATDAAQVARGLLAVAGHVGASPEAIAAIDQVIVVPDVDRARAAAAHEARLAQAQKKLRKKRPPK